jgi:hypothetical protein
MTKLGFWSQIASLIKSGRLYGGTIAIMLIDGQDPETPLDAAYSAYATNRKPSCALGSGSS